MDPQDLRAIALNRSFRPKMPGGFSSPIDILKRILFTIFTKSKDLSSSILPSKRGNRKCQRPIDCAYFAPGRSKFFYLSGASPEFIP